MSILWLSRIFILYIISAQKKKDGRIKKQSVFLISFAMLQLPAPHSITLLFFSFFPAIFPAFHWHLKGTAEWYHATINSIFTIAYQDILIDGGLVTVWIIFY